MNGAVGSLLTVLDAVLVTGAGWSKPAGLIGTNQAAYLSAGTCPIYLNVNDNGPGAASGLEARITGYETMSAPGTGTNAFPTAAQGVGGVAAYCVRKSSAAGTARSYIAFADAGTIYFFVQSDGTFYTGFLFGEFDSKSSSDTWRQFIAARYTENQSSGQYDSLDVIDATINVNTYDSTMGVADRTYTGAPGGMSIILRKQVDTAMYDWSARRYLGIGAIPYPNNPDGRIYVSQIRLFETSYIYRGTMRGLWASNHPVASFNDGDTFSGTGTLTGRTFRIVKPSGNGGLFVVETSATLTTP
jgi:hypothetical protein